MTRGRRKPGWRRRRGYPGKDAVAISRGFPLEVVGAEESHRLLALETELVARDTV